MKKLLSIALLALTSIGSLFAMDPKERLRQSMNLYKEQQAGINLKATTRGSLQPSNVPVPQKRGFEALPALPQSARYTQDYHTIPQQLTAPQDYQNLPTFTPKQETAPIEQPMSVKRSPSPVRRNIQGSPKSTRRTNNNGKGKGGTLRGLFGKSKK